MLGGHGIYQPMVKDPTARLENTMNLGQYGRFTGETHYQPHSSAGGLPHHLHCPWFTARFLLQPTVSFVSLPTKGLSNFLASLLTS